MTQQDIDEARGKDQAEIFNLIADLRRALENVLTSPDTISMDQCRAMLEEFEDLKTRFISHASEEASKWLSDIDEKGIKTIVATMRQSIAGNEEALRRFDEWRRTAAERDDVVNNPAGLMIQRIPAEEVVPTLCSLSPDDIELTLKAISDERAIDALRSASTQTLRDAVAEGYPSNEAAARLRALGVSL